MVMTLKRGMDKSNIESLLKKMTSRKKKSKGVDAYKYCGVIKLKSSPKEIQKTMRSEWD